MINKKNKHYCILLFFLFAFFTTNAQESEKMNTGAIGDVKYSILNPEQFAIVNGNGWVLLDGKTLDKESDLYKLLQATGHSNVIPDDKLPNGDGVFIRGVDTNDGDSYGDTEKNRVVGSYQTEELKKHSHTYTFDDFGHRAGTGRNNDNVFDNDSHRTINTSGFGGSETRPKNISLYTYIKIYKN